MLLVRTVLGQSRKHGIGLFADQFIPKDTPTWEYAPWFDISFTQEDLDKMSAEAREQVLWYGYFDKKINKFVLPSDDLRFINHSENSGDINIESTPDRDVTLRDIQPGEELLCNYNKFDDDFFNRKGLRPADLL